MKMLILFTIYKNVNVNCIHDHIIVIIVRVNYISSGGVAQNYWFVVAVQTFYAPFWLLKGHCLKKMELLTTHWRGKRNQQCQWLGYPNTTVIEFCFFLNLTTICLVADSFISSFGFCVWPLEPLMLTNNGGLGVKDSCLICWYFWINLF